MRDRKSAVWIGLAVSAIFVGCASNPNQVMLGPRDNYAHETQGGTVVTDASGASLKRSRDPEAARLNRLVSDLNTLVRDGKKHTLTVQGLAQYQQARKDPDLTLTSMIPDVARIVPVNENVAREALLSDKYELGDLAIAQFISERNGGGAMEVLRSNPGKDWPTVLRSLKMPISDATTRLDQIYNEIAFRRLDRMIQ